MFSVRQSAPRASNSLPSDVRVRRYIPRVQTPKFDGGDFFHIITMVFLKYEWIQCLWTHVVIYSTQLCCFQKRNAPFKFIDVQSK